MFDVANRHGFHFDTAQMPLNVVDAHFRSFAQLVVPRLVADGTGVLGMKALGGADRVILKSKTVWQPERLYYALTFRSLSSSPALTHPKIRSGLPGGEEIPADGSGSLAGYWPTAQQVAMTGQYELFKTTAHFAPPPNTPTG